MIVEVEFRNYLKNIYEDSKSLPPPMIDELRRAFYSAVALGISLQSQKPMVAGQAMMEIKKVSEGNG